MKAAPGFHLAVTAQPSPVAPSTSTPLALATPPPPAISTDLFDSALAALDPAADATSTQATTEVDRLDEAIAIVAREPYVVPLVVAQSVADAFGDLFTDAPTRKPSSHLA